MNILSKSANEKKEIARKKLLCQWTALFLAFALLPGVVEPARKISLAECVELAIENNRDIEQSESDRDTAFNNYRAARRAMGPKLSWQANAKRIGGKDYDTHKEAHDAGQPGVPAYKNEYANALQLTFPLYTGGEQENRIGAARYGLNAADLMLEDSKQTVKYKVAAAYYQLLQRKAMVGVEQEAVNTLGKHLDFLTVGYEEGTVAKSDVLASKVQLTDKEQALETAKGNYLNAMADLNNLVGLPVTEELDVEDGVDYQHYDISQSDALSYALANRPDGIAADYAAARAEKSMAVAKSGYRPSLSLVADKNLSGEEAFKENHSSSWDAGLSLTWTPFDNGVTSANVSAAKSEWEKAKSVAEQTREKIALDIQKAYTDLITAERNIPRTRQSVDMAREEYMLVQLRYTEGIDTNLAVTDAQEKLTGAQTNYVNALYNYRLAKAALDKAMGLPVDISAARYLAATEYGKSPQRALEAAAIDTATQSSGNFPTNSKEGTP